MWEKYQDDKDSFYDTILARAKEQLPEILAEDNRFVIPDVDSEVQGNRTFFRNFREVLNALNRPEAHFLKFLTNDLGTSGNVEGTRAIFQGKHARGQILRLVQRYVNDYVLCPVCGKPDTKFGLQGRVTVLHCEACGAQSGLRSIS